MRKCCLTAVVALAVAAGTASAQTAPQDSAHTTLPPAAPNPGRSGQVVQLPGGRTGVTSGGTANYQTLTTPGGSATMVPNGSGGSSVIGAGGLNGSVGPHR